MASVSLPNEPAQAPAIQKVAANSSFISEFEYDPTNLTLTTHLKSGAIYQHKFVTPLEFAQLQTSQNHSKHWSNSIKGRKVSVTVKATKAPNSEIRRKK